MRGSISRMHAVLYIQFLHISFASSAMSRTVKSSVCGREAEAMHHIHTVYRAHDCFHTRQRLGGSHLCVDFLRLDSDALKHKLAERFQHVDLQHKQHNETWELSKAHDGHTP